MKMRQRDGTMREVNDDYILKGRRGVRDPVGVHGCEAHGPRWER